MASAQNQHQSIHYEDIGSGMPVVLGHSFLCTGDMWRQQIRALSSSYRLINPDLRGHGRSGPVRQPFSLYDAVNDVVAVLDRAGVERAVWCGLSIGGMVAMRAALTVPERVRALVILDSDAGSERSLRNLKYQLMGLGARVVGVRPFLPSVSRMMFGATTIRDNPALVDEWRDVFADADVESILHGISALTGRDSILSRLPDIGVPSLVVVGEEDRSLPPDRSQRIDAGLPDSRLVVVAEAGHLSALEKPVEVNEILRQFLERVAADR